MQKNLPNVIHSLFTTSHISQNIWPKYGPLYYKDNDRLAGQVIVALSFFQYSFHALQQITLQ